MATPTSDWKTFLLGLGFREEDNHDKLTIQKLVPKKTSPSGLIAAKPKNDWDGWLISAQITDEDHRSAIVAGLLQLQASLSVPSAAASIDSQAGPSSLPGSSTAPALTGEGLYSGDPDIVTSRVETINMIKTILQKNHLVHIKAPPFSGKTSLAQLLAKSFPTSRVFHISYGLIYGDAGFSDTFLAKTKQEWQAFLESSESAVVIVDEAQCSYEITNKGNQELWQAAKQIMAHQYPSKALILLAAYGESEELGLLRTPTKIPSDMVIELAPRASLLCGSTIPGLLGTDTEFNEMLTAFSKKYFKLDDHSKKYLETLTSKHLGFVKHILVFLGARIVNQDRDPAQLATKIYECLNSRVLYDYIVGIGRGLPKPSIATEDELAITDTLLYNGPKEVSAFQKTRAQKIALENLIKYGWLMLLGDMLCFSSPIHERTYFIARNMQPRDVTWGTNKVTFEAFLVECVRRMDPLQLRQSQSRGTDGKLLERQWQMEFYRTGTSILGKDNFISPDVPTFSGNVGDEEGFLDFYINSNLNWGVELLREGNDMAGHCRRFAKGGAYYQLACKLTHWAVVGFQNCHTSYSTNARPQTTLSCVIHS